MNIDDIINFNTSTPDIERYSLADEKVLSGKPSQELSNHYSSPCDQFHTGVWQGDKGQWQVKYTEHEYCEILSGTSVIRCDDGKEMRVTEGDRFVIPAGFSGTWEVIDTCKKVYVIFEANEG